MTIIIILTETKDGWACRCANCGKMYGNKKFGTVIYRAQRHGPRCKGCNCLSCDNTAKSLIACLVRRMEQLIISYR